MRYCNAVDLSGRCPSIVRGADSSSELVYCRRHRNLYGIVAPLTRAQLNIRVPIPLIIRLRAEAKEKNIPINDYIITLLEAHPHNDTENRTANE